MSVATRASDAAKLRGSVMDSWGSSFAPGKLADQAQSHAAPTELVSVRDGFHYKHGAPDGALTCGALS